MLNLQKCAIIGCGNVGATCAYTLMHSGILSEIVLLDANAKKAEGEAMDLNHALPFLSPMRICAGTYEDLADCGIIIIAAGAGQAKGETRIDLLKKNRAILRAILDGIKPVNTEAILLLVSNPVDILTYIALDLSGFDPHRVIGSGTVLDTARLKFLVGRMLQVDSRNVHTFIIGEHGDSELPVWSSANVSGIDLYGFCKISGVPDYQSQLDRMFLEVRTSAYKIIENKGATYYAIAEAVLRIVDSIVRDQDSILPVSTLVEGHYGLSDICLGVPSVIGADGVKNVLDIPLSQAEYADLHTSAKALKKALGGLTEDVMTPV